MRNISKNYHFNKTGNLVKNHPNLEQVLLSKMRAAGLPNPIREYRFCPTRRWKFDFAFIRPDPAKIHPINELLIPEFIAVEVEGAVWSFGRHTRGSGFIKDCEKYNWAAMHGWMVLRYTSNTLDQAIIDLKQLLRIGN